MNEGGSASVRLLSDHDPDVSLFDLPEKHVEGQIVQLSNVRPHNNLSTRYQTAKNGTNRKSVGSP